MKPFAFTNTGYEYGFFANQTQQKFSWEEFLINNSILRNSFTILNSTRYYDNEQNISVINELPREKDEETLNDLKSEPSLFNSQKTTSRQIEDMMNILNDFEKKPNQKSIFNEVTHYIDQAMEELIDITTSLFIQIIEGIPNLLGTLFSLELAPLLIIFTSVIERVILNGQKTILEEDSGGMMETNQSGSESHNHGNEDEESIVSAIDENEQDVVNTINDQERERDFESDITDSSALLDEHVNHDHPPSMTLTDTSMEKALQNINIQTTACVL